MFEIIIHRVNKISNLKKIPNNFGCEIDIRTDGSKIILNHEPFNKGDLFTDYLDEYKKGTLVVNIKESGIENLVIDELNKRNINNYFLLDVEFPYIYYAVRNQIRDIAIRFSEDEPIEMLEKYINLVNWVWIDTNTILPIDKSNLNILSKIKSCLVSPDRWGRKKDILKYKIKMKQIGFSPTAVMTDIKNVNEWQKNI